MIRQFFITCLVCAAVPACVESPSTPASMALAPVVAESGAWVTVPIVLRGFSPTNEPFSVTPKTTWTHQSSSEHHTGTLSAVWIETDTDNGYIRPVFRVARVPSEPGSYVLDVDFRSVGGRVSRATSGPVYVLPFIIYVVVISSLLIALAGTAYFGLRHPKRPVKAGAAVLLAASSWWWFPLVLGGHTLFFVAVLGMLQLSRRTATPDLFVARASLGGMLFLELYWGTVISGSFLTAPIVSLSIIGALYLSLRWLLSSEGHVAVAIWVLFMIQAALYTCMFVYKAFFLDFPTFGAGGNLDQVGRIVDSIAHVVRVTHIMTLALPLVVIGVWAFIRRGFNEKQVGRS